MRTEVAQIRAVTTTGAPHPLHVPLPNPPLPPWPAARDPNHIRGSSHGPPSLFPCCRSVPAAKLKAPVREEAGGCSATSATSSLPTSSRAISSYRRGSLQSPGASALSSEEGLGRSIQGADALRPVGAQDYEERPVQFLDYLTQRASNGRAPRGETRRPGASPLFIRRFPSSPVNSNHGTASFTCLP
nr:uncharacterized protein LOC109757139 isoform X1 [Aegilops tauschii subsp. strangulata]